MNPLTFVLAMLSATVVAGPVLVPVFALGLYGWLAVLLAPALGAFGAGALALPIEREIKRQDPAWDERGDRPLAVERHRADGPRASWRR